MNHASPRSPQVSVIMANCNGGPFIEAAIATVLAQTMPDLELIVTDDASSDDSRIRVRRMAAMDARVRLLENTTQRGPAAARNRALDVARGDWVAVMDSDDLIHPERFARLLAAAREHAADIVADDMLAFESSGQLAPWAILTGSWAGRITRLDSATYARANAMFGFGPALGYLKPLLRRTLFEDGLRYRESMPIAEDYDLVQRLLLRGASFVVISELLYFYRRHANSISHRLSVSSLHLMLDADTDLRRLPGAAQPAVATALDQRRASLRRALHYMSLVSALKAKRFGAALRHAVLAPRAALLLYIPLRDRLRRRHARMGDLDPGNAGRPVVCVIAHGEATLLRETLAAEGCATVLLQPAALGPGSGRQNRFGCLQVARNAPQDARAVVAEPGLEWAIPYAPRPGILAMVANDAVGDARRLAAALRPGPDAPRAAAAWTKKP